MTGPRVDFRAGVARLQRSARLNLLLRRSTDGLFFGLLPALVIAGLAKTAAIPLPEVCAAVAAAVGLAAGALSALFAPLDRRRMLIEADAVLGSRELASTALELEGSGATGPFAEAIVEDAAKLLAGTTPRVILGRRRLPLAPFAALAALLTAAGLLFPLDLRELLLRQPQSDATLAQIGEDLRKKGQTLAEESRTRDLGRSLELSEQLAQLGSDLAARRIQPEDALDRMSDIESGLAQEYQLRTQHVQPDAAQTRPGTGGPGGSTGKAGDPGASRGTDAPGLSSSTGPEGDKALRDLGDALDRLRQAQRELGGRAPGGTDQAQRGGDNGSDTGGAGPGAEDPGRSGESGGSGAGSLPAPQKRGARTPFIEGNRGPGLQAQGEAAKGDSTRLLARTLPEWTGSRLPEGAILNRYSRQAESAFARDEIPLQLRQSVKEYFTVIGITK